MDFSYSDTGIKTIKLISYFLSFPIGYFLSLIVEKIVVKKYTPQMGMIVRKIFFYSLFILLMSLILNELGLKLRTILGAAGVAGIAIGFASQTSLSNVISGIFLVGEKTFQVGDIISVEGKTGIVLSIDLLSVKIKTFDNHFIRIPNESLIKTQVSNVTKFPIRRLDITVSVAYKSDLKEVLKLLREVAKNNEFSLEDPAPLIIVKEFNQSSIDILVGVWMVKTDFLILKNSMMIEIKEAFQKNKIEIPFPQRVVHLSDDTGITKKLN